MAVEMFKRSQRRLASKGFSANKHGHLGINTELTSDFKERKVKAVQLGFDAKTFKGVMEPTAPKNEDIFLVHYGVREEDRNRATINALSFVNWIRLDLSRTRSFTVDWNETAGRYEFEIPAEF